MRKVRQKLISVRGQAANDEEAPIDAAAAAAVGQDDADCSKKFSIIKYEY